MKARDIVLLYQHLQHQAKILAVRKMEDEITKDLAVRYKIEPFEDLGMKVTGTIRIQGQIKEQKIIVPYHDLDSITV